MLHSKSHIPTPSLLCAYSLVHWNWCSGSISVPLPYHFRTRIAFGVETNWERQVGTANRVLPVQLESSPSQISIGARGGSVLYRVPVVTSFLTKKLYPLPLQIHIRIDIHLQMHVVRLPVVRARLVFPYCCRYVLELIFIYLVVRAIAAAWQVRVLHFFSIVYAVSKKVISSFVYHSHCPILSTRCGSGRKWVKNGWKREKNRDGEARNQLTVVEDMW